MDKFYESNYTRIDYLIHDILFSDIKLMRSLVVIYIVDY